MAAASIQTYTCCIDGARRAKMFYVAIRRHERGKRPCVVNASGRQIAAQSSILSEGLGFLARTSLRHHPSRMSLLKAMRPLFHTLALRSLWLAGAAFLISFESSAFMPLPVLRTRVRLTRVRLTRREPLGLPPFCRRRRRWSVGWYVSPAQAADDRLVGTSVQPKSCVRILVSLCAFINHIDLKYAQVHLCVGLLAS